MTANTFLLNEESLTKVEALRKHFPTGAERSMILPTLWLIQDEYGYIPAEAVPYVAKLLPVPEICVQEVVSWYSMFQSRKVGKYHVQVCRNLSCALRGAEEILGYLEQKLGIGFGETTADGKFTLSTAECLASCGTAPMMHINKEYYENLTKEKIDQILSDLK